MYISHGHSFCHRGKRSTFGLALFILNAMLQSSNVGAGIFAAITLVVALLIDELAQGDVLESLSSMLYILVGMAWSYARKW